MAQVAVTQYSNDGDATATLTGVTAGRMLIAVVIASRFFGNTPALSSVSGGGATWATAGSYTAATTGIFFSIGTGGTGGSITVTASGTWDGVAVHLYELNAAADAFDVGASTTGNSAALSSGATATLASDEDLAIGAAIVESQFNSFTAVGGGYTLDGSTAQDGVDFMTGASHLEVTSTTGTTGSFTANFSNPWRAAVITIKPAGGGAGLVGPLVGGRLLGGGPLMKGVLVP